ncbi:uncharacterized protein LOC135836229 [Planococcus citri]|uniref:uncharacterized protein LOC135836229 n=1 Tax=Planococcus citri TaxID=170843 RepID=UPI0031FA141A
MVYPESKKPITKADVAGYEKLHFRSVVGGLGFVANATRPDIAYAVNQLSRNQENPKLKDWRLMKRVIDYLRGSAKLVRALGDTISWKREKDTVVHEDNLPAEYLAKSKKTGRLKHVDISYHMTKDLVEKGRLIVKREESKNQTAVFLMKPLDPKLFCRCREECMDGNSEGANP